jgi:hypothetical protein
MTTSPYSPLVIKQGSTFEQTIPATLAQSLGFTNLVGIAVASSIVTGDAVEHHLVVTVPDPAQLAFSLRASTVGWKIGDANWDIKFTRLDGRVTYSPTTPVKITKHFTS